MRTEYLEEAGITAGVSIHEPRPEHDRHVALLYFHGGGLLYGERDDLPACYIALLLERGYTLYCFDYPLAPEAPLDMIQAGVVDAWRWFIDDAYQKQHLQGYALFGRSAGAYLALWLAARVRHEATAPQPCAVIDFYGFHTLADPFLAETPVPYRALPSVDRVCLDRLAGQSPVTSGPKQTRFSLYICARQHGLWLDMLGVPTGDKDAYSCSDADVAAFPPLFITASTTDAEVPYRLPKALYRQAPCAHMKTVYNLDHDFDRDVHNPAGCQTYTDMLAWLDGIALPA